MLPTGQQTHLAALEEIGNGGCGFAGIAAAARYGEDEIAEGQAGPMNFAE